MNLNVKNAAENLKNWFLVRMKRSRDVRIAAVKMFTNSCPPDLGFLSKCLAAMAATSQPRPAHPAGEAYNPTLPVGSRYLLTGNITFFIPVSLKFEQVMCVPGAPDLLPF